MPLTQSYILYSFEAENLENELLSALQKTSNKMPKHEIKESPRFKYLCKYLNYANRNNGSEPNDGFETRTIIIELKYVDSAFLLDHQSFYSTSFREHDRYTQRLHFFSKPTSEIDFEAAIQNGNPPTQDEEDFWESYLGCVVIKPLRNSLIGSTLLKHYGPGQESTKQRSYPVKKKYCINLFGKTLTVETLAFQEQDRAVAACATTALWTAFHKTSELFTTKCPAPSQITQSAGFAPEGGRIFPNDGLQMIQVTRAIGDVGLSVEITKGSRINGFLSNIEVKRIAYAYSRAGLPVLLAYRQKEDSLTLQKIEKTPPREPAPATVGTAQDQHYPDQMANSDTSNAPLHLVAVLGYRWGLSTEAECFSPILTGKAATKGKAEKTSNPLFDVFYKADFISRLYCHDDQVGPFCKIGFKAREDQPIQGSERLFVHWIGDNRRTALGQAFIVPIKPNIRIRLENVERIVRLLNTLVNMMRSGTTGNPDSVLKDHPLIWDIYLEKSNSYKEDVKRQTLKYPKETAERLKDKVLGECYPKYIWVAKCEIYESLKEKKLEEKTTLFEAIFDSTGVPVGFFCFQMNYHHLDFEQELKGYMEENHPIRKQRINFDKLLQSDDRKMNKIMEQFFKETEIYAGEESFKKVAKIPPQIIQFIHKSFKDEETQFYHGS